MCALKHKLSTALNSKIAIVEDDSQTLTLYNSQLQKEYFNISCYDLANSLLGKLLVRRLGNVVVKGRIVETECYLGNNDKASHSRFGRRTPSSEPMYMAAGTAYVYKIYGMYHCFNISSIEPGGAVLIRALEPVQGIEKMQELRSARRSKEVKIKDLCKGPSNLCISLNITKESCNKIDLCTSTDLWLESDTSFSKDIKIVNTSRIGISPSAEEWTSKALRFYMKDNIYVSKRDKNAEKELDT